MMPNYKAFTPLRFREFRRIEAKYDPRITAAWRGLENELFDILGYAAIPTRRSLKVFPTTGDTGGCGCGQHGPILKNFSEQDEQAAANALARLIGSEAVQRIRGAFQKAANKMMIGGKQVLEFSGAIFNDFYRDVIRGGYRFAWKQARRRINGATPSILRTLDTFEEMPDLQQLDPVVRKLYTEGFDMITSKITIKFQTKAMQIIGEGMANRVPGLEIARQLHREIGVGARWHWTRLMRTEMAIAVDRASTERYRAFGVQYFKYSYRPVTACQICRAHGDKTPDGSTGKGWYTMNSKPLITEDTHPNCFCINLPKWRLPMGAIPN